MPAPEASSPVRPSPLPVLLTDVGEQACQPQGFPVSGRGSQLPAVQSVSFLLLSFQ